MCSTAARATPPGRSTDVGSSGSRRSSPRRLGIGGSMDGSNKCMRCAVQEQLLGPAPHEWHMDPVRSAQVWPCGLPYPGRGRGRSAQPERAKGS